MSMKPHQVRAGRRSIFIGCVVGVAVAAGACGGGGPSTSKDSGTANDVVGSDLAAEVGAVDAPAEMDTERFDSPADAPVDQAPDQADQGPPGDALTDQTLPTPDGATDSATPGVVAASCKAIRDAQPTSPSGMYWIDPNGPPTTDAFQVYCDMQTNGGGWTKVSGLAEADINRLRGDLGRQMLKCSDEGSAHIISPPFSEDWSWMRTKVLQVAGTWVVNGMNQSCGSDSEYAFAPCNTWWGVGCGNGPGNQNKLFPGVLAGPTCGDRNSALADSTFNICGALNFRSWGVFVRAEDIRLSKETAGLNCKAILAAQPTSPSGLYWLDPNGVPSTDAFPVYCEMQTNGGGWTKINGLTEGSINQLRGTQGRQMLKCSDEGSAHIISPPFSSDWSWMRTSFLQVGGTWVVNGTNQSCGSDPEYAFAPCSTWWGVGCGNGPGDQNKLFPGVLAGPTCGDRSSALAGSTFNICGALNFRSWGIFIRSND